jgi:hypothetical protein
MTDARLQQLYQEVLRRRVPADRAACVTPERLLDLVERRGPEEERLRTLDHAMGCARCRDEFELLRSVTVAAETRPAWRSARVLALAASVALLVGVGLAYRALTRGGTEPDVFRGPGDEIGLVAPIGAVPAEARLTFVWHAQRDAMQYRLEVLDAEGAAVFSTTTRDTSVTAPESLRLAPGARYRWWVRATLRDGSDIPGSPREFVIVQR